MKIAIVGAHGTGKTTLAKALAEKLNYRHIPDIVRQAYERKFVINEQTPPETQFWILSKQLELERNTEEPWVSDKSLFDNVVYGSLCIADKEVVNVIRKIVLANARYDLIFYLPIEFPLADDGLRSLNADFQKNVDAAFRGLLREMKLEYFELAGTAEERVSKALELIKNKEKKKNGQWLKTLTVST